MGHRHEGSGFGDLGLNHENGAKSLRAWAGGKRVGAAEARHV